VLYRFAKVPYTEQLFASLGAQLARVLCMRYGVSHRAAVVDADPSLPGSCETPRVSTGFLAKGGIGDPCVRVHPL
jgi:hypothetical protein